MGVSTTLIRELIPLLDATAEVPESRKNKRAVSKKDKRVARVLVDTS